MARFHAVVTLLLVVFYIAAVWWMGETIADIGSNHQPTLVMCTSELEHLTAGGAGVVVADSSRALIAAGWHVIIVLDIEGETETRLSLKRWLNIARNEWSAVSKTHEAAALDLFRLSDLATERAPSNAPLPLLLWHKSHQWARALRRVEKSFHAVEFWDCGAPSYHALLQRRLEFELRSADISFSNYRPSYTKIWIRTHGLHQDIINQSHHEASQGLNAIYRMETRALQLADAVIANSPATGRAYRTRHRLDQNRICVIPPTLATMSRPPKDDKQQSRPSLHHNVLVYGKVQRVKGPDLAARAVVRVMRELGNAWRGVVVFAGDDMPCDVDSKRNMSDCILFNDIPSDLHYRFRFVGRIRRGALGTFSSKERIRFVILPSRYETFCLAAHEAAYFRLPVVLPRLPAYEEYFVDGVNAITFIASSVDDLTRAVRSFISDDDVVDRIARAPHSIRYPDPAQGYQDCMMITRR